MTVNTCSRGLIWLEAKGNHRDGLTKVSRYYTSTMARSGIPGWWFEFAETDFSTDSNGYMNLQGVFQQRGLYSSATVTDGHIRRYEPDRRLASTHGLPL
jgi:hypothetical protein